MSGGKSSATSKTANRMKKAMKGMKYKQGGKPDYIDIDGDGNRTESMKSAAKSKKKNKAKYGRKRKMMGGMQQDPNMMQQPMQQDPMMDQQAPMAPGDDFIEPETQIKFGAPRDKAILGLGRLAGAVKGFRKNKGKGLGARLKGAAAGALGGGVIGRAAGAIKGARGAKGQGFKERFKAAAKGALQGSGDAIESRLNRRKKSSAQAGATGGKTRTTRMRKRPARSARKQGNAGSPEVEPREQKLFGGGGRAARQARRADRKAARQDRRAARQEMRQDRRAARQEIRQLPREERRAARQEMRQDFKERRQGIRQDFKAAKQQAGQPMASPMANNAAAPAAVRKPVAPAPAPAAAGPMKPQLPAEKPPVAAGMSTGGFDKNISAGQTAFRDGGKKPRNKALFGRIANAIRKGRAAKAEGKKFGSGLGKEIAKGAATGSVGMAVDGVKSLRSPKEARQARKQARRDRRAARREMTGAERRADRKAARQERRAARKERRAKRKAFRQEMREDRRDVRAFAGGDTPPSKPSNDEGYNNMPPPMTAVVKDGARKDMIDRRVKKKAGGYGIEKTASGKKMADTLGVTKNRKKAVGGIRKSNRLHAKKKKIEGQMKDSIGAVNAEGAKRQAEGKKGPGKLKKQLERRRAKVEKIENRITKHRRKNRTA